MSLWYRFDMIKRWWRNLRNPPAVIISRSGQATSRPQVHVSVASVIGGTQGVYTWDATDQGEACATMYGKGLAEIMQRRLIDERTSQGEIDG